MEPGDNLMGEGFGGYGGEDPGPEPTINVQVPEVRGTMSPFDYTREQIEAVRRDMRDNFQHERAYRRQYGQMAANAMVALSEQGWVTLKLASLNNGQDELKEAFKEEIKNIKSGQTRIFVTAFGLLISTLSLAIAVIFNVATR